MDTTETKSRTRKKQKPSWPRILSRTLPSGNMQFRIDVVVGGNRIYESFPTEAEAIDRAWELYEERKDKGRIAFNLPVEDRIVAERCIKNLAPYGIGLEQAVDYYINHVAKYLTAPTITEVVEKLLAEKEQKNLRATTLTNLRHRWEKFAEAFGTRKLNEVTGEELTAWLFKQAAHPVNRHNYRRKIGSLYRLAIKRKWAAENIVEQTERPEMGETVVGILRVEQVIKLLAHAPDHGFLPFAALGLFAGVRPDELKRLDWKAVNLARRQVVIGPEVAKTKQQRILPLNETALAWLATCVKKSGPVVEPANFRKRFDAWRTAAGIKFADWPKDCVRHSFGTYHYGQHNNPVETARLMGHVGVDIFFRHYRALVDEDEAKRFWALRPVISVAAKIMPMVANS